jgi:hypothetical protein
MAKKYFEITGIKDLKYYLWMHSIIIGYAATLARPIQVTFGNGSEFKSVFEEMCDNLGIKSVLLLPTSYIILKKFNN